MDYIDYALNQYYQDIKISDDMQKLKIDDFDEYINYLADEKEAAELELAERI